MSRMPIHSMSDKFVAIGMPVGKWTKSDKRRFVVGASVCSILPSPSIPVIASRFVGLKRRPIRNYFGMRRSVAKDFKRIVYEVVGAKIEEWEARFG